MVRWLSDSFQCIKAELGSLELGMSWFYWDRIIGQPWSAGC